MPTSASLGQGYEASEEANPGFFQRLEGESDDSEGSGRTDKARAARMLQRIEYTPWKTNIDPENHWLVEEHILPGGHCQGPC